MKHLAPEIDSAPPELLSCINFHGHMCPGLVYGYRVAEEAKRLLGVDRSHDEEVVAISENRSCAVDALQALLGTSMGKGNLIINDYGKNVYTIFNRSTRKGFRFSRNTHYNYRGNNKDEFQRLEETVSRGNATEEEKRLQKKMKAHDLMTKPFDEVFTTISVDISDLPYAELARSVPCAKCGEMTMATKMTPDGANGLLCIPCAEKK
jgi:formylmethanofuran dehydrogenase subunit E